MEKQYLIFVGDKKIFADTEKKKNNVIKGLKNYEYMVYKRVD